MKQQDIKLEWVHQEHPKGCCVACVAMVLGVTYEEARALFKGNVERRGVLTGQIVCVLHEHGFRVMTRPGKFQTFAPVHIALCRGGKSGHAVVVDEDGDVLDPAGDSDVIWNYEVALTLGIWPNETELVEAALQRINE